MSLSPLEKDLQLAQSLCMKGKYEVAGRMVEGVLKSNPDSLPFLLLGSLICRRLGRVDEARGLSLRATEVGPDEAATFNELGVCCLALGEFSEAVSAFERAVLLDPLFAAGHFNLGFAFRGQRDSKRAFVELARAIELAPNQLENYREVFEEMKGLGNWGQGLETFQRGVALHPQSVALREALGHIYGKVGLQEDARRLFTEVIREDATRCRLYSDFLRDQGLFDEALSVLSEALRVDSELGFAYLGLAEMKTFDESFTSKLASVLTSEGLADENRMCMSYSLAMAHDRDGEFDKAFPLFVSANAIGEKIYCADNPYDRELAAEEISLKKEVFKRGGLGEASQSETPILIVGMIRSGTTMLDQMLSAHPLVASAGERHFWRNAWALVQAGRELDASDYLRELVEVAGDSPRITDKMPLNFEHLGLVALLFPRAKILHIRRDPLDTCLSIFTTHLGPGPHFGYNLANIGSFYRDYLELMSFWRSALPSSQLLEVDYEELVSSPESVMREVLSFCGLEWDDACLRPELNTGPVGTPSKWQVRQPIYRSSVGRWKNYEPWLGELRTLLPQAVS